ncbi:hypothetical protein O181_049933 [Austropuccinia psidii MF-1]|uniref:Uncharacterized protein n=1 Tax=Austropuccinia psidii MF-1 TaxID=1389203 RepID=A0A9Q3HLX1_9BASI|nr:hypothetical protein [Austropuccinia psidii MF-1]
MPRGYSRKSHPELYQTNSPSNFRNNNIKSNQKEPTMSTKKLTPNPAESEPNANNRLSQIRTTISQATALIKNEHMLKLDGPTISSDDKICHGILIYSLPEAIQSKVIHLQPCKAIHNHLRHLYHVITQAGQLSGLEELLNTRMQSDEVPSSYALILQSSAGKFTQCGGNFSKDLLLRLLIQRGIQDQEMARTVMLLLENEVSNKGCNQNLATCHQIL